MEPNNAVLAGNPAVQNHMSNLSMLCNEFLNIVRAGKDREEKNLGKFSGSKLPEDENNLDERDVREYKRGKAKKRRNGNDRAGKNHYSADFGSKEENKPILVFKNPNRRKINIEVGGYYGIRYHANANVENVSGRVIWIGGDNFLIRDRDTDEEIYMRLKYVEKAEIGRIEEEA